ncbi:sulfurtransferase TusA family protein [Micromonospora sp. KC606]|uniref:sulfurtransferase TusA family protein n=1 Tax=Micromonospora sp. KC606 TaxID=2530379 RepID=UPI001050F96F|nr:sulfurtransferase TusA family protein [Micromonospora sp. KC606]TDC84294.1 sulfurtransferase TusA family protein [Micromonospora sp. KC606]
MSDSVVLDGGDRRCVQLLIELRRLTLTVEAGTLIHLIATDPAAPLDLPAWCHLTGHTYLGAVDGRQRPTMRYTPPQHRQHTSEPTVARPAGHAVTDRRPARRSRKAAGCPSPSEGA